MTTDQCDEQRYFIVFRDDESINMALHDASRQEDDGRSVPYDVWRAILPIVLALEPGLLAELTAMDVGDALDVGFDDEMRSLYSLLGILAATGSPTRAAEIARGWAQLQLDLKWWHRSDCDKPLHAQLLGTTSASAVTLDSVVPDWLLKLVEASRDWQLVRYDTELHWTSAKTPLGRSCIAWTDDDETNPGACLAISDCGVQFLRPDDPNLLLSRTSIKMLFDSLRSIIDTPEIAQRVGWDATGHETMEIREVLTGWMDRLDAAAEAGATSGLSTAEVWDWIRDHGGGGGSG